MNRGCRSFVNMGGAIWWRVSTICLHKGVSEGDVSPEKLGIFVFLEMELQFGEYFKVQI